MTPEPREDARCASSGSWSPKKRRNTGSLSSGWRGERISLEVETLTTEGVARCTASLYEATRELETSSAGALWLKPGAALERAGSQSGRNVVTTNSTATAIVVACEKMSQSRAMGACLVYKNPLEN